MNSNDIILFLSNAIFLANSVAGTCSINLKNDVNNKSPMIITIPTTGEPSFVYPDVNDVSNLHFQTGQSVTLFCPGKPRGPDYGAPLKSEKSLDAGKRTLIDCNANGQFSNRASLPFDFKDISCTPKTNQNVRYVGNCGQTQAHLYQIGYTLEPCKFLTVLEVCHDKDSANTLWAHSFIRGVNTGRSRYTQPMSRSFKSKFYDNMAMSSNDPYSVKNVYATVMALVNDPNEVDKYLSTNLADKKYLARGHLIAKADLMHKHEQESTFFLVNVVPMWQKINAVPGNWFYVEEHVRELAASKRHDLEVWAGGIDTLAINNVKIELYPPASGRTNPAKKQKLQPKIPVPKVLFKCVADHQDSTGLCYLVVNSPELDAAQIVAAGKEYVVCPTYAGCDGITDTRNLAKESGYMYCCELKDFYDKFHREIGWDFSGNFTAYSPLI